MTKFSQKIAAKHDRQRGIEGTAAIGRTRTVKGARPHSARAGGERTPAGPRVLCACPLKVPRRLSRAIAPGEINELGGKERVCACERPGPDLRAPLGYLNSCSFPYRVRCRGRMLTRDLCFQ